MPDDRDMRGMSVEELRQLRNELKRQADAKTKATRKAMLYPHATTSTILQLIAEAEMALLQLRTAMGQWESNLTAVGAERMAKGDLRPKAIGE